MNNKQKVLIVEDEIVNRKILKKILSPSFDVVEAENGEEGWKIIQEKSSELAAVLLDIVLPLIDGYEVLERIQQANIQELPVIVTTGSTNDETEKKALDLGAWDFVTKPYNGKVLLSRLKNAIARSEVAALEKVQYISWHDELTGLYNRSKMFKEVRNIITNYPENNYLFARYDIKNFGLFNTSFGENEGDLLLKYVGKCIEKIAEQYEIQVSGRMNADIFCIFAKYSNNPTNITRDVEEFQKKLSSFKKEYSLEASVGVFMVNKDNFVSVEDCYYRASIASQKCKDDADNHLTFYDKQLGEQLANEVAITNMAQKGIDNKEFVIYLQPKINLISEKACGAEALVRWNNPAKGMIFPGQFIPVFEKNGFISKLDYYMWESVCQLIRKWLDEGRNVCPISVNISRISLYNPKLASKISDLVAKYKVPPSLFQLEVTESAYMSNAGLMRKTIESLHQAGFTILMDDFGSGYSSLNTLKEIHVDILKADIKFLPVVEDDKPERGEVILASVIKMAKWLGMGVVVEGVETRKQRDFIESTGCDYVQGYYYSKPISVEEYIEKYMTIDDELPKGTTFENSKDNNTPLHNMTILVIDDSQMDRYVFTETLSQQYNVVTCEDAEQGLAYLSRNKQKVKLIIVDNQMSGMSGIDFLKYCQHDITLNVIPKIMITVDNESKDQIAAFKAGAYDFITKPFIKEVLMARVNHVMEISKRSTVFDSLEQEYSQTSEIDSATKLLNKLAFNEYGSKILETLPDDLSALMVIDIDNFKYVNDKYGHLVGDSIISTIAKEMNNTFRKSDIIGRFGGDEFVVMMTKLPQKDIAIRKASDFSKDVFLECNKKWHIPVSVSVGLAFSQTNDTIDSLFGRADQALYEAKTSGKQRVIVYGETVPVIKNDDKPIVLICGEDPQLYPAIALSYGEEAAFDRITSYEQLLTEFNKYGKRICVICLDLAKKIMHDADKFYSYIMANGGGKEIPIIAVYRDDNMDQLRQAMELDIYNVLTLPPQRESIQHKISNAIIYSMSMK